MQADYEPENEICLDNWNPDDEAQYVNNDDENNDDIDGEYDEDDENIPAVVIENPPYRDTVDMKSCLHKNTHGGIESDSSASQKVRFNCDVTERDCSSQPWFNPKFQPKEESSSCATLPIRR